MFNPLVNKFFSFGHAFLICLLIGSCASSQQQGQSEDGLDSSQQSDEWSDSGESSNMGYDTSNAQSSGSNGGNNTGNYATENSGNFASDEFTATSSEAINSAPLDDSFANAVANETPSNSAAFGNSNFLAETSNLATTSESSAVLAEPVQDMESSSEQSYAQSPNTLAPDQAPAGYNTAAGLPKCGM